MFTVQGIYENLRSCFRVGKGLSDEVKVKVSVHQGPVLSPLLFIIVLDDLLREMGMFQLTGSRASLSAFTRERVMLWTEATIEVQQMKVIERVAYSLSRQVVTIKWSTFGEPLCM